jgi:hypothetical protein
MKPHNIASITAEPDPNCVTFTCRVKMSNGGELVLHGPDAIDVFYAMAGFTCEQYDDEKETVH